MQTSSTNFNDRSIVAEAKMAALAVLPPIKPQYMIRDDVSPVQIARANEQIHKFAQFKRVADELMESSQRLKRGYDAAVTTNFNTDFKGTYGTANTEIFTYFYNIWARVRTLAKDTPQGKAIMRTYRNNIVGHDPFKLTLKLGKQISKPHPKTGAMVKVFEAEEDSITMVEAEWKDFCGPENFTIRRTISFMEAMNQVVCEAKSIGSVLIREWFGAPNKYGYAVDILESDRIQPNFNTTSPFNGYPIRASIERHPVWDYPTAYFVLVRHPGEFVGQNYPGSIKDKQGLRERIPAEEIIHFNNLRDRAEQDLGFTELDACVQAIWRLFQYQKALTYASISSCMKPFWIKKNYPTGMSWSPDDFGRLTDTFANGAGLPNSIAGGSGGVGGDNASQRQQGIQQRRSTETPGATLELDYGLELMQTDPKFPIEAAHEFQIDNSKEIAAAAGISYSDLTGDFQSLGYIAAQMSQRPSRDEAIVFQEHVIANVVKRIFKNWWSSANTYGVFDFPQSRQDEFVRAARFRGKRFPFTDELREVQALVLKLDAKLISPQKAQDMMADGEDVEEVISEWSDYYERLQAYGINPMDAPTTVTEKETQEEPPDTDDDDAPTVTKVALNKTGTPKGSKTAKMQKSRRMADPAMTRYLLADARNGH